MENAGGMQRVSLQLTDELERKKSVRIIKETVNASGKGWIVLTTIYFWFKLLFLLPGRVRRGDADIVVFSSMVTASLAFFIRNRLSVPMVTINHGRDVTLSNSIYQHFVPYIFKNLDGVISVSSATRRECIKRGMKPQQGVAIPNGFDFRDLDNFPGKVDAREFLQHEFGIPLSEKKMLLTVGRQVKRKGHEWFIRKVLSEITSDIVYVTIGEGPRTEKIKKTVDELGLNRKVYLMGRQPDTVLKKAYAAADIFIMPNIPVEGDMEGFGIVLLEANMAGTPAVASDLEGIKDVIANGKNGYRVPAGKAGEFAQKIDSLLKGDLTNFSEQTKLFVKKHFSWQRVANQYITYFEGVYQRYMDRSTFN